jgi:outer membrane protein TolC
VFDGGNARAGVRSAELGMDIARAQRAQVGSNLAVAATEAYGSVLAVASQKRAASAAVEAALRDLEVARNRRAAGLVTDADVLALEVHLASTRARHIEAEAEERVARTRLNDAIGAPLDEQFEIDEEPGLAFDASDLAALEREALEARSEVAMGRANERLAAASRSAARSAFLPQLAALGGYEWNGSRIDNQVSSWLVGAEVRVNLFHGFADKSRMAEAGYAETRAAADRERAENAVRLDVRAAVARLEATRARERVGRASVAQAAESQRIVHDRYQAGMASVADLLRAAETALAAESAAIAARVDVLIQTAHLERALGR